MSRPRARRAATAAGMLALWSGSAWATKMSVTAAISPNPAPAVGGTAASNRRGGIVRGTSNSTATVAANGGAVTVTSGNAVVVASSATATAPTVTFTCTSGSSQSCNSVGRLFTVTITPGSPSPSGSATLSLTSASVANFTGAASPSTPVVAGGVLTFTFAQFSGATPYTATFNLGVTLNVGATAARGVVTLPYTVMISGI